MFFRAAGSSLRSGSGGDALGWRRARAKGRGCRAVRAWRGQPRSRKWPLTRGTEQGLPRLGSPLQSNSRRSPEERQAAAAARPPAVRSPQPGCLAFPHSISCHCNANPITRYRLASPSGERRKRRSGTRGTGVGRKGREEGRRGTGREQTVRLKLSWAPVSATPPPPPPRFSKTAFSAPPAKRGLGPAAPVPGAESRVHTATCEGRSRDGIRTHVYACSPAPRASSSLPRRPRQVEGWGRSGQAGVWRREPQKGFPAWANVVLASRGERGSGRPKTTPAAWPPLGPQLRQSPRAGRRSAQGSRRPESLGVRRGARRGGEREEEEEEGEAESWRPGCERKAVCGHVVRYVPRARAAIRSRATSKPGARLSRLPPRSAPPSLLPSCVSRRAHQYGQRREAPPGQRHPAFGLQPAPPRPAPDSPRAPRLRTPLLFRMPLFAFARGRAGFHLRPGVITGDTLSPPRRPRSSRIRSA